MRFILCLATILAFGFAPAPVYRQKPDPAAEDLALLQGKWTFSTRKSGDQPPVPDNKALAVFEKSLLTFPSATQEFQITLDPTKKERVMKLWSKEMTYIAFYQISGDDLVLCFSEKNGVPPKSISGGRGMYVYTFKRAPKP